MVSFSNTEVLLQNAKIVGQFDAEGLQITEGMLGGAVSFEDLEEVVLNDPEIGPQFADVMLAFLRANWIQIWMMMEILMRCQLSFHLKPYLL